MEKIRRTSREGHEGIVLIYLKVSIWKRDFLILWVIVVLQGIRSRGEHVRKARKFPQGKKESRKGHVSFCQDSGEEICQSGAVQVGIALNFSRCLVSWRGGKTVSLNL